jgi:fructoselysine 6-kinase
MNTKLKLLSLTPCCVDYYPQLNKSFLGGNSLNVAAMWKKLEPKAHVSVITCLGTDANGEVILDFFKKINIDYSRVYIKDGTTATNKLRVDETGERFGIEGAWNGGVYQTFLLSDKDWDWVVKQDIVAMPGNNPNFFEMIKKKHEKQLLSVDYIDTTPDIPFEETFEFTDIAFVPAGKEHLPKYKALAYGKNKLVVLTLGAEGSYAFYHGETFYQPALPVPKVIDTTGCGDAYQAAFALTYFKTRNIKESMHDGAMAATKILAYWGGVGKVD